MVFLCVWRRFSVVRLFLPSLLLFTSQHQLFTMMKCDFVFKRQILCNTVPHSCLLHEISGFCHCAVLQYIMSKLQRKKTLVINGIVTQRTMSSRCYHNKHRATATNQMTKNNPSIVDEVQSAEASFILGV